MNGHSRLTCTPAPKAAVAPGLAWLRVERGTRTDYDALAHWHYRAGAPATFAAVLRAVDVDGVMDGGPAVLAGVLVVSHPTLNGPWRERAWPGALSTADADDPAARARRLNAMVRTISRVVVDPRYRGSGVATALVRAYLDRPLTPLTEAVASMGALVPLFTRSGMRCVSVRSAHSCRMAGALRRRRLAPWRLLDLAEASRWARCDRALVHEARRWANASRATRALMEHASDAQALALAAAGVAAPARVFVAP